MKRKDTYLPRITPFCTDFQLIIDLPHVLSLFFHSSFSLRTLLQYHPFLIPTPRPCSMPTPSVCVYHPLPPDSFLLPGDLRAVSGSGTPSAKWPPVRSLRRSVADVPSTPPSSRWNLRSFPPQHWLPAGRWISYLVPLGAQSFPPRK